MSKIFDGRDQRVAAYRRFGGVFTLGGIATAIGLFIFLAMRGDCDPVVTA